MSLIDDYNIYCYILLHSGCGVFILTIDEDPARSCEMLQAGDEIISVNDYSLLNHTHQECLQTLRTASGNYTTLTIRRHKLSSVSLLICNL